MLFPLVLVIGTSFGTSCSLVVIFHFGQSGFLGCIWGLFVPVPDHSWIFFLFGT